MSIAGFDPAAYEGDLDEDMKEAGKTTYIVLGWLTAFLCFHRDEVCFLSMYMRSELFWWLYFLFYVLTERGFLKEDYSTSFIQTFTLAHIFHIEAVCIC